ncbi:MAG: HlyD family secretion protein [Bacteroidota bacterium]|nr:HlyD family secretion protein [Bacteroidota bacterium]
MKKRNVYVLSGLGIIVLLIIWLSTGTSGTEKETILVPVKFGTFEIDVTTTGELDAKTSEDIKGPSSLRDYRIWNVTIKDIISDGTKVDSGDYVARLDDSELENKIQDEELELENLETQFLKTQLDTAMTLRAARDELINLKYNLEERQIVVDQSIYEPPATQRQAMIDLDKTKRAYTQAVENYQLKLRKAQADMQEVTTNMKKVKNQLADMKEAKKEFIVTAPKSGMLNYRRNWNGKKIAVGDQISTWDPVVARLPNLDAMISKTYINEIDISKVKPGQQVEIGVDAFPDRHYTGSVREVATMGQQMQNSNAKVYEVIIDVNESDTILKPAMTTKNRIITAVIDSVSYIPIECLQSNDSMSYVYTERGRRQVITGANNENEIIVKEGLDEGDEIFLVAPEDAEERKITLLDTAIMNKYIRMEEQQKQKQADKKEEKGKAIRFDKNMSQEEIQKLIKEKGLGGKKGGKK